MSLFTSGDGQTFTIEDLCLRYQSCKNSAHELGQLQARLQSLRDLFDCVFQLANSSDATLQIFQPIDNGSYLEFVNAAPELNLVPSSRRSSTASIRPGYRRDSSVTQVTNRRGSIQVSRQSRLSSIGISHLSPFEMTRNKMTMLRFFVDILHAKHPEFLLPTHASSVLSSSPRSSLPFPSHQHIPYGHPSYPTSAAGSANGSNPAMSSSAHTSSMGPFRGRPSYSSSSRRSISSHAGPSSDDISSPLAQHPLTLGIASGSFQSPMISPQSAHSPSASGKTLDQSVELQDTGQSSSLTKQVSISSKSVSKLSTCTTPSVRYSISTPSQNKSCGTPHFAEQGKIRSHNKSSQESSSQHQSTELKDQLTTQSPNNSIEIKDQHMTNQPGSGDRKTSKSKSLSIRPTSPNDKHPPQPQSQPQPPVKDGKKDKKDKKDSKTFTFLPTTTETTESPNILRDENKPMSPRSRSVSLSALNAPLNPSLLNTPMPTAATEKSSPSKDATVLHNSHASPTVPPTPSSPSMMSISTFEIPTHGDSSQSRNIAAQPRPPTQPRPPNQRKVNPARYNASNSASGTPRSVISSSISPASPLSAPPAPFPEDIPLDKLSPTKPALPVKAKKKTDLDQPQTSGTCTNTSTNSKPIHTPETQTQTEIEREMEIENNRQKNLKTAPPLPLKVISLNSTKQSDTSESQSQRTITPVQLPSSPQNTSINPDKSESEYDEFMSPMSLPSNQGEKPEKPEKNSNSKSHPKNTVNVYLPPTSSNKTRLYSQSSTPSSQNPENTFAPLTTGLRSNSIAIVSSPTQQTSQILSPSQYSTSTNSTTIYQTPTANTALNPMQHAVERPVRNKLRARRSVGVVLYSPTHGRTLSYGTESYVVNDDDVHDDIEDDLDPESTRRGSAAEEKNPERLDGEENDSRDVSGNNEKTLKVVSPSSKMVVPANKRKSVQSQVIYTPRMKSISSQPESECGTGVSSSASSLSRHFRPQASARVQFVATELNSPTKTSAMVPGSPTPYHSRRASANSLHLRSHQHQHQHLISNQTYTPKSPTGPKHTQMVDPVLYSVITQLSANENDAIQMWHELNSTEKSTLVNVQQTLECCQTLEQCILQSMADVDNQIRLEQEILQQNINTYRNEIE